MLQALTEFEDRAVRNQRGTPFLVKAYKDGDGRLFVLVHSVPMTSVVAEYTMSDDVATKFQNSPNGRSVVNHLFDQVERDLNQPGNKLYEA